MASRAKDKNKDPEQEQPTSEDTAVATQTGDEEQDAPGTATNRAANGPETEDFKEAADEDKPVWNVETHGPIRPEIADQYRVVGG